MTEPTMCLTTDDVLHKTQQAIASATETLNAFNFSETLVQREVHLVRLQVDIQLNKLENRAQLILKDLAKKENKRLEYILNQLHDISESLKSPSEVAKNAKEHQMNLANIAATIKKLMSVSQRQKIKFKENMDIQKAFEKFDRFGDFFLVAVSSATKHRTSCVGNANDATATLKMCLPGLRGDTLKQNTVTDKLKVTSIAKCSDNKNTKELDPHTESVRNSSGKEYNPFTILRALNKVQLTSFSTINDDGCKKTPESNKKIDVYEPKEVSNKSNDIHSKFITENVDKNLNTTAGDNKMEQSKTCVYNESNQENIRERRLKKNDQLLLKRSRSASPRSARSSGQIHGILKTSKAQPVIESIYNNGKGNENEQCFDKDVDNGGFIDDINKVSPHGKCVTFNLTDGAKENRIQNYVNVWPETVSFSIVNEGKAASVRSRDVIMHGQNMNNPESQSRGNKSDRGTRNIPSNSRFISLDKTDRKHCNEHAFDNDAADCSEKISEQFDNSIDKRAAMRQKRLRNRSINIPLTLSRDEPEYEDNVTYCGNNEEMGVNQPEPNFQNNQLETNIDDDSYKQNISRTAESSINRLSDGQTNSVQDHLKDRPLDNPWTRTINKEPDLIDNKDISDSKPTGTGVRLSHKLGYVENKIDGQMDQRDRKATLRQKRLRNRSINIPWSRSRDLQTETETSTGNIDRESNITSDKICPTKNGDIPIFSRTKLVKKNIPDMSNDDYLPNEKHSEEGKHSNAENGQNVTHYRSSDLKEKRRRNRSINIPWSRKQENALEPSNQDILNSCSKDTQYLLPNLPEDDGDQRIKLENNSSENDCQNLKQNSSKTDISSRNNECHETSPFVSEFCTLGRNRRQRRPLFTPTSILSSKDCSKSKNDVSSSEIGSDTSVRGSNDTKTNGCARKLNYESHDSIANRNDDQTTSCANINEIISDDSGNISDETRRDCEIIPQDFVAQTTRETNRRNIDLSARLRLPSFDEMLFCDKTAKY